MIIRMPKTREPLEGFFTQLKMGIFTDMCLQIRDSWVGIIRLRAGQQKNPGSTPCRCKIFLSKASRHAQGSTSLSLIVYRSLLPGVGGRGRREKRLRREGNHSPPYTVEVQNKWNYAYTSSYALMVSTGTVVSLTVYTIQLVLKSNNTLFTKISLFEHAENNTINIYTVVQRRL
jgi:hypothetical protein